MNDYTNSNPGCFHSMIKYLSSITGIRQKKEVRMNNVRQKKARGGTKIKDGIKSWDITVVDAEGNRHTYMQGNPNILSQQKRFDMCGIVADHFLVSRYRSTDEFGIAIKNAEHMLTVSAVDGKLK